MRATVLPDARLQELAGRFAWLDIDTEQPRNFAFVEKFPIEAWPTLYVIDPASEQVVLRWMGSASVEEVRQLLLDAERRHGRGALDAAGEAMARGARAGAARRHAEAAVAYREALAAGGPAWSERPRAADALVQALAAAGDQAGCAGAARELLPGLPPGPAAGRIAATGLGCANELDDGPPHAAAVAALEPLARQALKWEGVLSDDRSGLYDQLAAARRDAGDAAGARRDTEAWLAWIEAESARAPTPLARSALDAARLSAALALGTPERALPALQASAQALPDQYFAWQYLAICLLECKRPQEALEAIRHALPLAEGPRKVRVLTIQAQALAATGDRPAAVASAQEAIRFGEALPEPVRPKGYLRLARKVLKELEAAP